MSVVNVFCTAFLHGVLVSYGAFVCVLLHFVEHAKPVCSSGETVRDEHAKPVANCCLSVKFFFHPVGTSEKCSETGVILAIMISNFHCDYVCPPLPTFVCN